MSFLSSIKLLARHTPRTLSIEAGARHHLRRGGALMPLRSSPPSSHGIFQLHPLLILLRRHKGLALRRRRVDSSTPSDSVHPPDGLSHIHLSLANTSAKSKRTKVLNTYTHVLAPMAPHLAEEIHHFAKGATSDPAPTAVGDSFFRQLWIPVVGPRFYIVSVAALNNLAIGSCVAGPSRQGRDGGAHCRSRGSDGAPRAGSGRKVRPLLVT